MRNFEQTLPGWTGLRRLETMGTATQSTKNPIYSFSDGFPIQILSFCSLSVLRLASEGSVLTSMFAKADGNA